MYNYREEMKEDIIQFLQENCELFRRDDEVIATLNGVEYVVEAEDPFYLETDRFEEALADDLWCDDGVTGNCSGSYFFNRMKAEEALVGNLGLLAEAVSEFGSDTDVLKNGAEVCDVTIRCYLLSEAVRDAVSEWLEHSFPDDEVLPDAELLEDTEE